MLAHLGEKNFLRVEVIPPLRGDVYDRNGVLLAANRPVFDLYWQGTCRPRISDQDQEMLRTVSVILGIDLLEPSFFRGVQYAEKFGRRVLLKADVDFHQLCQISEKCPDSEGLVVSNKFKRTYPHAELAGHVLGYLNKDENVGRAGIEMCFDAALQGQQGELLQVINSTGKTLAQRVYKEPKAGTDIKLTLDADMQRLAEGLFEPDQCGALIVMDPYDGAVRVLASFPRFDPNTFLNSISEDEWNRLNVNHPLLNRATSALYPPASTFKLVTFAAALEEKVIDTTAEICCVGHSMFCGRKYHCIRHTGHGTLGLKQALAVSCNIPCYSIARKLKIDKIAAYAELFGLGEKTNFVLPERSGLVPTSLWKRSMRGERWWKGETLSVSIGQGALLVTPLQNARVMSAICTGSLVKPRLIDDEPIERRKLNISHETLTFLRTSMKEAVDDGSVKRLSYLKDFDVYAKTGTAQTCSLEKEKKFKHEYEHGWVVGYFSYKGQKPLTLVVLFENTGSSSFAVDIAYKFFKGYKALMGKNVQTATADKDEISYEHAA